MRVSPWYLALIATLAPVASLCGAMSFAAGHLAVLVVTVSIFWGTLSLRRETGRQLVATHTPLPTTLIHVDTTSL